MNTDAGSVDQLGENRRLALLDAAVRERAGMARGTSADERIALRRDLLATKEAVEAVRDSFSDPVGLLYNPTLDSSRRDTIASNLARQGPRACHDAMKRALATGDAELGAAALDRFDTLSDDQRDMIKISKAGFAEALVSEELAKATRALLTLDVATEEVEILNLEAEGKGTSRQRIALGLKRKALDALPPEADSGTGTTAPVTEPKAQTKAKTTEEIMAYFNANWADMMAGAGFTSESAGETTP